MFSIVEIVAVASAPSIPSFSIPVGRTMFADTSEAFVEGGKEKRVKFEAS